MLINKILNLISNDKNVRPPHDYKILYQTFLNLISLKIIYIEHLAFPRFMSNETVKLTENPLKFSWTSFIPIALHDFVDQQHCLAFQSNSVLFLLVGQVGR